MPSAWLVKTEPSEYSFDDLVRDKKTRWEGVKNPMALKHMRAARKGDLVVVYHTGKERRAVGLARVAAPAGEDAPFELTPERRLATPVTLDEIKASRDFADSPLVKIGRLSIVPLTPAQLAVLTKS